MNIVLHEPEIPFNTGAIGRTCVATKSTLHLIKPYGFILNDKNIKKAGMDYWSLLKLREYISYEEFIKGVAEEKREMEKAPREASPIRSNLSALNGKHRLGKCFRQKNCSSQGLVRHHQGS